MISDILKWGVAGRPLTGETLSGDLHLVRPVDNGVLVAVADGLGHGKSAAEASAAALTVAEQWAHEPLVQVLQHCHQKLRTTRGAAMSLAFFNAMNSSMTWVGVGNVEGLLVRSGTDGKRARESLVSSAGVVGVRLPPLHARTLKVAAGDTLILATDGIRRGFGEEAPLAETPDQTAQGILARDGLGTDDALVLVATYQGRPR
ncbi:MAG TPA: SpoIIE family protein phosphatase [Terriglobia bacterium]|nr:SpoIIE family protein phosphatase [Terriglobia bacterium]